MVARYLAAQDSRLFCTSCRCMVHDCILCIKCLSGRQGGLSQLFTFTRCVFVLLIMVTKVNLLPFSDTAYWVHHRPPGSKDQRDQANVRRPDQNRKSSGWIDRPPGHHHRHTCQHQSGRVPHERQVRRSVIYIYIYTYKHISPHSFIHRPQNISISTALLNVVCVSLIWLNVTDYLNFIKYFNFIIQQ